MSDVFISYAHSTEAQARKIAEALRALGYSIWRDDELPAHRSYADVIEERLLTSKAVLVLWCAESVKSQWVRAEAEVAREHGTLVQLSLDGAIPPLPFNQIQSADLAGWTGDPGALGWRKVADSVAELVRQAPQQTSQEPEPPTAIAVQAPPTRAEAAWSEIEASLDPRDYADFLDVFAGSEWAFEARRRKRRLEAWSATDQTDLLAVTAFLKSRSFAPLQAAVQTTWDELRSAAFGSMGLSVRATASPTGARAAALAKRTVVSRSFTIERPGIAAWPQTTMVAIPPGRFVMGSSDSEARWDLYQGEEEPLHEVEIDYVFALGRVAVTLDAFAAFIADSGHDMGDSAVVLNGDQWNDTPGRGWRDPGFAQKGNHPVTCASWYDAQAFIAWLNDRLNLADRPDAYRLPSEAEWEYACRAETQTPFSFGATISTDQANINGLGGYDGAEPSMQWRKGTTPAGRFPANSFGLHDMHGNTWEWCEDAWNATYQGAPSDGSAWLTGSGRVIRGGSWLEPGPSNARSAVRYRFARGLRLFHVGFRLARTLSPPTSL
jgi:formylglycine-generating enzyme required for sulfatase activity